MTTQTIFRDSKTGARVVTLGPGSTALHISGSWSDDLVSLYRKYKCNRLWIQSGDGDLSLERALATKISNDLQLLGRFSNIKIVQDAAFLKGLNVQLVNKITIDLSRLNLHELSISTKILGQNALPVSLRSLSLTEYNQSDIRWLGQLIKLKQLHLGPARNLESLDGVDNFANLEKLAIWHAPHLTSIQALVRCKDLVDLRFNGCKSINDIQALDALKSLKRLHLNNCGDIESLLPLSKLNRLAEILFVEDTNIRDGAIKQLVGLPSIKRIWFQNRRHYDITREVIGLA